MIKSVLLPTFIFALIAFIAPVAIKHAHAAANITVSVATITGPNALTVKVNGTAHNTVTTVDPTKFHVDVNAGGVSPLTPTGYTISEAEFDIGAQFILTFSGTPFSALDASYDASHGLYIDASGVTDNGGNTNVVIGHASSIAISDSQVPTATTVSVATSNSNSEYAKVGDEITLSFVINETIDSGSVYAEINAHDVSGTAVNVSGNSWEVTYTMQVSDTEGLITFYIEFTDLNGNLNYADSTTDFSAIRFDKTAPVVAAVSVPYVDPSTDEMQDFRFTSDDNGTISYGGSCNGSDTIADGGTNDVQIGPLANGTHGDCTLTVADAAGNVSNSIDIPEHTINAPTPSITFSAATPVVFNKAATTVTVTFSEAVTGFAAGDIQVANGSLSNFSALSATVYTFTLTPSNYGAVRISVAADAAIDAASNGNTAAAFSVLASHPSGGAGGGNYTTNFSDIPTTGRGVLLPAPHSCTPYLSTNLRAGDRNEAVIKLQTFLMSQGLFSYPTATGFFGSITSQAVKDFQEKYAAEILTQAGLTIPSGFVGPMTLAKINAISCK